MLASLWQGYRRLLQEELSQRLAEQPRHDRKAELEMHAGGTHLPLHYARPFRVSINGDVLKLHDFTRLERKLLQPWHCAGVKYSGPRRRETHAPLKRRLHELWGWRFFEAHGFVQRCRRQAELAQLTSGAPNSQAARAAQK